MADLPTPDFAFNADAAGACLAGIRPYRVGSYRLDAENVSGKFVVHNYGHGGCGITLSWGCAAKVRDLVARHVAATPAKAVAVLGAGVMGLTAATLLRDLGLDVTVYSDREPADTTSHKAGGQWAVSVMEFAGKERELGEILRAAYARFKGDIGKGYGVSEQPNYTVGRTHNFEIVLRLAPGLIPPPVRLAQLPFMHQHRPGWKYQTLLIEPPIFLARLEADLRARGVTLVTDRKFETRAEVFALPQPIVVNCTGVGALRLWNDPRVTPIKGQLAMLKPQPALHYLWGLGGYMFPRSDHVVIGGTFEMGVNNETIDKAKCRMLVDHVRSLFGVGAAALLPEQLPEWHIDHPDNAAIVHPPLPPEAGPVT